MKAVFFLLLFFFAMNACQPSGSTSQVKKTTAVSFDLFLEQNWSAWQRLPEHLWMDPFSLLQYNTQGLIESEIDYLKNTWLQLDINGDGATDELGLLQNRTSQKLELLVFLNEEKSYRAHQLRSFGSLSECCLSSWIERIPPDEYFDLKNERMISIPHASIRLREYNQAAFIYYFDDGEFKEFQTVE